MWVDKLLPVPHLLGCNALGTQAGVLAVRLFGAVVRFLNLLLAAFYLICRDASGST